jgi:DNA-binding GntR family transcriptional regulator
MSRQSTRKTAAKVSVEPSVGSRRSARRPKTAPASADGIADRVLGAILSHQLPPGTQLVEERLAAVFHVSRTKIRQALARLAHDGIVTVIPNRGAFVSSPTVDEARAVFDARRLIEPHLVRKLAAAASKDDIAQLRAHVRLESTARASGDKRAIIRLSGQFHEIIAGMAGNPFLARTIRELESLTCLVIILYDAPNVPSCPYHEHSDLIDAIAARDGNRAASLMVEHLNHVEGSLDLSLATSDEIDLEAVFAA